MEHFAGLDVSVKETSVCIVDDVGKIVREVKVASEPFGSSRTKFPVTWSRNTSIGQSIFVHPFLSSMSLSSASERRQSAQPMSVHDVWLVTRAARSPFAVVQFLAPDDARAVLSENEKAPPNGRAKFRGEMASAGVISSAPPFRPRHSRSQRSQPSAPWTLSGQHPWSPSLGHQRLVWIRARRDRPFGFRSLCPLDSSVFVCANADADVIVTRIEATTKLLIEISSRYRPTIPTC